MFLLSISSHALAKVEIWLCNSRNGIDVFRIDTNWPLNTAQRINSRWKKLWASERKTEVEDIYMILVINRLGLFIILEKKRKK